VKIGMAGMGRMGAAMARRLLDLGHELSVWNRSAAKTQPLAAAGARVAATPAALAGASEVIISILTDAPAIEATYTGPDGVLAGDVRGKLVIEMSTVRPHTQRALAAKVAAAGAAMVDCPVGGTTGPAREGKLIGFAGGDEAAYARARPILEQLCRRVEHVGPVGSGASMKLAINLPLMIYWQALGEALVLAKPLGLDPARVIDIFADTSGGPNVLRSRGPMIAKAIAGGDTGPVTFDLDSMRKDLQAMIAEAQSLGWTSPLAERTLECFDQASQAGLGDADAARVPARWVSRS
jgi:3-hydroxyisobutyrate dehydrogenase